MRVISNPSPRYQPHRTLLWLFFDIMRRAPRACVYHVPKVWILISVTFVVSPRKRNSKFKFKVRLIILSEFCLAVALFQVHRCMSSVVTYRDCSSTWSKARTKLLQSRRCNLFYKIHVKICSRNSSDETHFAKRIFFESSIHLCLRDVHFYHLSGIGYFFTLYCRHSADLFSFVQTNQDGGEFDAWGVLRSRWSIVSFRIWQTRRLKSNPYSLNCWLQRFCAINAYLTFYEKYINGLPCLNSSKKEMLLFSKKKERRFF